METLIVCLKNINWLHTFWEEMCKHTQITVQVYKHFIIPPLEIYTKGMM